MKTGQDPDRAKVGKNIVNGTDLGAGIVESTLEELISCRARPAWRMRAAIRRDSTASETES